jgi:hypothetical protein
MSTKTLTQTQTDAVNAYGKFLQAGISYGEAMRKAASELGGTPCPTLLGALAKVHATKYECNYTWDGKGRAVFYNGDESTRDTRNDAARKSWERNVMVWFKPEKPATPKTHARLSPDARKAAKAYLAQFESLKDAIAALKAVA